MLGLGNREIWNPRTRGWMFDFVDICRKVALGLLAPFGPGLNLQHIPVSPSASPVLVRVSLILLQHHTVSQQPTEFLLLERISFVYF